MEDLEADLVKYKAALERVRTQYLQLQGVVAYLEEKVKPKTE